MEDLAVITALNHTVSFGKNFNKLNVVFIKLNAYGLGRYSRPRAQFFPIRTSRLANNIYITV